MPREALALLAGRPEAVSVHLLGQAVRVLWSGPEAEASVARLLTAGEVVARVRPVEPDMEAVFAYLAENEAGPAEDAA